MFKLITLSNLTPQHPPDAPTACGTARGCSKSLQSLTSEAENSLKYLLVPMASISSMNTMEGACSSATLNSSRTSLGPSPRYFWMSSDPTTRRKVAEVWLATALASSVLPLDKKKQTFKVGEWVSWLSRQKGWSKEITQYKIWLDLAATGRIHFPINSSKMCLESWPKTCRLQRLMDQTAAFKRAD